MNKNAEVKKIIPLTCTLLIVSIFTMFSIAFSFKYLGLKGQVIPILGCLFILYLGIKIEIIRRHYNIRSYYDLSTILNNTTPNPKIAMSKQRLFAEKGLLVFLVSFFLSLLCIIVGFLLF